MRVITICGSLKYYNEMLKIAKEEITLGDCVLLPFFDQNISISDYTKEDIIFFRKAHLKRIDLSDAILVITFNNEIGKTTSEEIQYAKSKGKEIIYYNINA